MDELSEHAVAPDPIAQFTAWYEDDADVEDVEVERHADEHRE
jgi:hypothetical protein